eukprot:3891033-Alexandrium_andersonii.AAC.1
MAFARRETSRRAAPLSGTEALRPSGSAPRSRAARTSAGSGGSTGLTSPPPMVASALRRAWSAHWVAASPRQLRPRECQRT